MPKDIQKQFDLLIRGTSDVISSDGLKSLLISSQKSNKKLIIKAGFDPTAPDIHLGHVVLLRKLRQFQDMGHEVYFLIGDFTALIGDPTGKDQLRPSLTKEEIAENAQTYKRQVFKVLDEKRTRVVFNSQWLKKLSSYDMLKLTTCATVAQMLARADFNKRYHEQKEISLLEFIYPLLQGYDSIELKADVELGGSDQRFNLLMGRQMQEIYRQKPQVVMMTPLLEGTDGVQKMSKSLGNYIGINDEPNEMFGKLMSISDQLMYRYYELLTDLDLLEVKALHPREAKMKLGQIIVEQFHGAPKALNAQKAFESTFSRGEAPQDIDIYKLKDQSKENLVDILIDQGLVPSKKEFKRLIKQGAVSHDNVRLDTEDWAVRAGIIKVGKRRFLKLV